MKHALFLALVAACSNEPAPAAPSSPAASPTPAAPSVAADAAHGTIETHTFASTTLGVDKHYIVYLPAGYATSGKRYPVFYYLHGLGGDQTNWTERGELDKAADALGLEAIVVMPDGDDGFYVNAVTPSDYDACLKDGTGLFLPGHESPRSSCVRKRDYETYIVDDLVHEVDARYRTIARKNGRAIAGLSMGGYGALELGMRHTDLFAAAASHSGVDSLLLAGPFPYPAGEPERALLLTDAKKAGGPPVIRDWMATIFGTDMAHVRQLDPTTLVTTLHPGELALYIDCGTEDDFGLNHHATYLHDLLVKNNLDHVFYLGAGHHAFSFWRVRVRESLAFLRDHTAHAG